MEKCPCGSGLSYSECCEPLIKGDRESLHPDHRGDYDPKSTKQWAESAEWQKFEIIGTEAGGPEDEEGAIEFIATFVQDGTRREHHERAKFRKVEDRWFFESGEPVAQKPVVRESPKIGRNEPCICGSGKKYKKCCGA
jgi:SEC-C motif-containing protein